MPETPINEFEQAGRRRKARTLADALWTHLGPDSTLGLSADRLGDHLANLSDDEWAKAAELVGINTPSPETRQLVVSRIRRRPKLDAQLAAANADPFAGLPVA